MRRFLFGIQPATWTAMVLAVLTIGVATVTNPNSPDLGQAVTDLNESPVVMRVGVVTDIEDADNITVRISGTPALIQASYLFPQYGPVLGDRVVVIKQDAQWFVIGTMSGPINSALTNPSFEIGTLGSTPTDWSISVVASGGGVPTFTKVNTVEEPVSGSFSADFGTDSVAAGFSEANVYSSPVSAGQGSSWTAAYFIALAAIDQNATTAVSGGRFTVLECYIQFLDGTGTLVNEQLISTFGTNANYPTVLYKRPSIGTNIAVADSGTESARIRFHGMFDMSANSFTSLFLDYVILRQVD